MIAMGSKDEPITEVLDESEVNDLIREVQKLVTSPIKLSLLLESQMGVKIDNLENRYSYNKQNIADTKGELKQKRYLKENNGQLTLTDKGEYVVDDLENFLNSMEAITTVEPFFDYVDCEDEYIPDFGLITQATAYREKDDIDQTIQNLYKSHLENSSSLRELLPFSMGLDKKTEIEFITSDGFTAEYILSEDFLSTIQNYSHYKHRMYEMTTQGEIEWYVVDSLPYMLSIFDENILLVTQDPRLKIALEADNGLREWATDMYENIKKSANSVRVEDTSDGIKVTVDK